jgi:hypothetical protein
MILFVIEMELEKAEGFLAQRIERKKEFYQKQLEITEKRTRKWMVQ